MSVTSAVRIGSCANCASTSECWDAGAGPAARSSILERFRSVITVPSALDSKHITEGGPRGTQALTKVPSACRTQARQLLPVDDVDVAGALAVAEQRALDP